MRRVLHANLVGSTTYGLQMQTDRIGQQCDRNGTLSLDSPRRRLERACDRLYNLLYVQSLGLSDADLLPQTFERFLGLLRSVTSANKRQRNNILIQLLLIGSIKHRPPASAVRCGQWVLQSCRTTNTDRQASDTSHIPSSAHRSRESQVATMYTQQSRATSHQPRNCTLSQGC
jgi:hypothetical protein